jgi:hypothetical protein
MMAVTILTGDVSADTREATVVLDSGTTCGDVIRHLEEALQTTSAGKGAWLLEEEWHGCSKLLTP